MYDFEHFCFASVHKNNSLTNVTTFIKVLINRVIQALARALQLLWQYVKAQNARVMKTTKLFLIIAVVTLTAISYGSHREPIAEAESSPCNEVSEQALELENWMLVPFKSNYAEEDIVLENWMSAPFESNYAEEDVEMENWMATAWI